MRSSVERKKYKLFKYIFAQVRANLKYKHGVYNLKWTQREGPLRLLDLYTYRLTNNNLDDIIKNYYEIRAKARYW